MATARKGNPYEGGGLGAGGKFRKRPFRRTQTTPYDRPPTALRNPSTSSNNGWFSKLVDPAQRLITSSAHRLFSSVFRKRLPAPAPAPSPPNPPSTEAEWEARDNHEEAAAIVTNDSSVKQQGAVGENDNQMNCSDKGGITELEKLLKQKTFTRSEIDHLTALLRSKTVDSPVTEEKRTEVVASELMSREQMEEYPNTPALQNGSENRLVSTPFVSSSVIDKDVASPAELAKAYMGSRPSKVSPTKLSLQSSILREDPTLLNSQYFAPKSPIMSIVPRATSHDRLHENGFVTPRSRGRSAIYSMARTPYSRVYPTSTLKGVRLPIEGGPSSSAQSSQDHDMLPGSGKGALKRRSSVLDNDIGSIGPMRRIRQKSNLLTSTRGLSSSVSGSHLPIIKSVRADSAQQPSSMMQKALLLSGAKHSDKKLSAENIDDTMPSTSLPFVSSKSSEMASKILQQLDKLSPKEKSSELKLPTVNDKSPTKLSPSMLRGQALRSMETVDSSKFLDNIQDNKSDGLHENFSADAEKLTSQKDKLENGPLKLVAPSDGVAPVVTDADATMSRKGILSNAKSVDSSMIKSVPNPSQKRRAFHMSAHEDYLDLDDDVYPNGAAPSLSTGKEVTDSTLLAEKNAATETGAQEMPSVSSVAIPLKNSRTDVQTPDKTCDGSIIGEKFDLSTSVNSSTPGLTFKPAGVTVAAITQSTFGSDKSTLLNGSVAASPSFNFGNNVVFSTELTAVNASSKELSKPGPIFSFGDKTVSSKESVADAPLFNFGSNKSIDKVPQMPFTTPSSIGADSPGLKFCASDSKLGNSISSTPVAGGIDSMTKVPDSDNADAKTNTQTGFSVQSLEPAVSSAASTSLLISPTSIFSFGHSSNQNNGPPSKTSFSSPFPTPVSNNFTSQNMFSSSSLGASSSNTATAVSTSSSMTASTAVTITSSSSPSSVATSSSPAPFFKFGSSPVSTTDLPVSSSKQDAGFGILSSTTFGSSSAAAGSTGNSIFGLSSSAMTTVNSQSQGSVFGSSTSLPGAQASPTTSGFASSTQSQSTSFGSSASSPSFGLSGNTAFSSGSSMFPSSPATNVFNSGTSFGLGTSASSSAANTTSSNSGATSSLFGLSTWQPSKSPFGSTFSSSSSSGFSFGVSTGSAASTTSSPMFGSSTGSITSTSSPMFGSSTASVASTTSSPIFGSSTASVASTTSSPIFGSSTASVASTTTPIFGSSIGASSSPMFSFTSAAAVTSTQPVFGSPNPVFAFGSAASVNNDQMSMEDSMAEDTVQATPPATPVFGQQPTPPQSNFVFGASAPSGASPFQFGGQQNIAPQNPSPFQASGSLEFNAGGSFSLGTGGGDKSGRKYVKVKHSRPRKK